MMKMKSVLILTALMCMILLSSFTFINNSAQEDQAPKSKIIIPAEVQAVVDNSCYGCHNMNSKNEKGKKKLAFDALDTLSTVKLIGKLSEITEVVSDDDMPPAKFLEHKPEAKLTIDQKNKLINWSETLSSSLMKK